MESTNCKYTMHCLAKHGTVPYLIVANKLARLSLSSFGSSIFQLNSLLCYEAQVVQRSNEIFLCLCLREYNIQIIDFIRG